MASPSPEIRGQRSLNHCLEVLARHFAELGATQLDLPFLYPSDELLNLYGEDLRARAFPHGDPERGDELCLRPDFTVPVALAHREQGWDRRAMYTYSGPVFRLQPLDRNRPVEYMQAGIERFCDPDLAATDAEVFMALRAGVQLLGVTDLQATVGDLSIILAVLDGLEMPARRRAALKRHLWRPSRFQALLDRAVTTPEPSERRLELLALNANDVRQAVENAGEDVGLRTVSEVLKRLDVLGASEPSMPAQDATLISDVLGVRGSIDEISARIAKLTSDAGVDITSALDRFDERLQHLLDAGCSADELTFDAAFGRSLEYYDGFVFEIRKAGAGEHPPLAGGGRYNTMTTKLGAEIAVPAIGGIVRPEAVLEHVI
mgnify:CR=1 FL=1